MKKKSRFLTGLLSAVMALSLFALPAAAAGDATPPTTTASTIDKTETGSITIHKYLQENADPNKTGGTGEDNQTAPKGAEPAGGVGFTVYQVMNADDLVKYYDGVTTGGEVTVKNYVDENGKIKDKVTIGEPKTMTTTEDGLAKFDGLPVGLYVVIETSKPASVTQAVTPFLVSIPMTRRGETNKGAEWLYDVVVYPKNNTTTGNFKLVKYGVVGNNKEGKVPVENVQFQLEHLKDGKTYPGEEGDWETINASGGNEYFVTNEQGEIAVNDLKPGTYRFTEIGYANGKDKQYIVNKNDQYAFVVGADGSTATKVNSPDHDEDYDVSNDTISVYNYVPDVDKKVQKGGNWQKAADYSVGDKIPYQITVTVPANIARLKTFTVTDTPTNLTDDVSSIAVKSETATIENNNNETYTATKNGDGFEIAFEPEKLKAYAGQTLTITYTATLKNSAVTTTDGNYNTVNLIYSKNVKQGTEEDDDTNTIKDGAVVYTFEINVLKKADGEKGKPLDGVTFDLYKEVASSTDKTITGPAANALGLDKSKFWLKINGEPLKTANGGKIQVSGLENGTYKLVETKTLDGYNLLSQPVDVTLDIGYKTTWEETSEYKNGVLTKHDVTKTEEKFESNPNGSVGTQAGTKKDDKIVGVKSVIVINRKGFNLPTTGGFGTLLFSGIGALLVVGGIGVLMSTKKKKKGNA